MSKTNIKPKFYTGIVRDDKGKVVEVIENIVDKDDYLAKNKVNQKAEDDEVGYIAHCRTCTCI